MSVELPVLTIVSMAVSALVCAVIPFILLLVLKKTGADVLPFFTGFAVFMLFALVIEGAINYAVSKTEFGGRMLQNLWAYAVYGGLMAGIFEETGRFIAFKTVLRKRTGNDLNALMYGAGHGGFEAIMTVSVTYLTYIALMTVRSLGKLGSVVPQEAMEQLVPILDQLCAASPSDFLLAIVERCSAIVIHISLSVIVWFGAKKGGKVLLFPFAILRHAVIDAVMVIAASKLMLPAIAVEGVVSACAAAAALTACIVWRRNRPKQQ